MEVIGFTFTGTTLPEEQLPSIAVASTLGNKTAELFEKLNGAVAGLDEELESICMLSPTQDGAGAVFDEEMVSTSMLPST